MARGSMWTETTMHAGRWRSVRELISEGSHYVAVFGNTSEGWQVSLASTTLPDIFLPVSPLFHRDFGDTRTACMEACKRAYGVLPKVRRGPP